jgi:phosphoribosylpyrophosphate synthetase
MARGRDIKIISGNSNMPFAESVCRNIGLRIGNANVTAFSDGEISVSLFETVRGSDVFIIQSTCNPVNDHLNGDANYGRRVQARFSEPDYCRHTIFRLCASG